jgi:predicted hotdog family 3-hydroxylacyl-ACP dehydratase
VLEEPEEGHLTVTGAAFTLPVPAEEVLPHRPPMLLLTSLTSCDGGNVAATASVARNSPLALSDGTVEESALVELLAQGYAALLGWRGVISGRPVKKGFLVGARALTIHRQLRAGEEVTVTLRTVGGIGGFALAEGEVTGGDGVIASGTIKLFSPAE